MPLGEKLKNKKAQMAQNSETTEKPKTFVLGGRYEVDNLQIGKGVSSVVMSAIDLETHQKVAVKRITKFLENKHESLRILREIILLRMMEHPNIIKLREVILEG